MLLLKRTIALALALVVAACARASGPEGPSPRGDPDVITAAELERYGALPVRQAIERLRPRFLRFRGSTSLADPNAGRVVVYLGESRMGGVEFLDQIMTTDVQEIRYLDSADATQRFGTGHTGGAIVLRPR